MPDVTPEDGKPGPIARGAQRGAGLGVGLLAVCAFYATSRFAAHKGV